MADDATTTPAAPSSPAPAPSPAPAAAPSATPAQVAPAQMPVEGMNDPNLQISSETVLTTPADDGGDGVPPAEGAGESTPTEPTAATGADKRVQDAQRRMHLATEQAAQLRQQIGQILTHPDLGPRARAILTGQPYQPATPAPAAGTPESVAATPQTIQADIKRAIEKYKAAPSDDEALAVFASELLEAGQQRTLTALQQRQEAAVTQQQVVQAQLGVKAEIEKAVQEAAPDVPLPLFWSYGKQAKAETPANLTGLDRLEWQTNRALTLAREVLDQTASRASAAAAETARIQAGAAQVMPGGGSAPAVPLTHEVGPTPTFEQIWRDNRRGEMPARR